jgi:hypothetical protein
LSPGDTPLGLAFVTFLSIDLSLHKLFQQTNRFIQSFNVDPGSLQVRIRQYGWPADAFAHPSAWSGVLLDR